MIHSQETASDVLEEGGDDIKSAVPSKLIHEHNVHPKHMLCLLGHGWQGDSPLAHTTILINNKQYL